MAHAPARAPPTCERLGGTVAIAGGWYITRWSHAEQEPDNHAVDRSAAVEAAQRYNQSHGVSVSRSF